MGHCVTSPNSYFLFNKKFPTLCVCKLLSPTQSPCIHEVFDIPSILPWRCFNTIKVMHHFKRESWQSLSISFSPLFGFWTYIIIYTVYISPFSLKAYITWQQIYLHKAYSSNVDSIYSNKDFYFLLNLSTVFSSSFSQLCIKTAPNSTWSHTFKTFPQWRKGPLTPPS